MTQLGARLARLEARAGARHSCNVFAFAADPRDADAAATERLAQMPERDRERARVTVFTWLTPESGSAV